MSNFEQAVKVLQATFPEDKPIVLLQQLPLRLVCYVDVEDPVYYDSILRYAVERMEGDNIVHSSYRFMFLSEAVKHFNSEYVYWTT